MEVRLALGSSHSPFSSAFRPPHAIGGLSQSKMFLGGLCGGQLDGRRLGPPRLSC